MSRILDEKRVVDLMVRIYCRRYEGNQELCSQCRELIDYCHARLDRCKFGEAKTTCKKCPVHCYSPSHRERIRQIMRWVGPRMIFYHPIIAIRHLLQR